MTVHTRRIPALPADVPGGGALGRHVRHDERSRLYPYLSPRRSLQSAHHVRRIPVLDQGSTGKCTAEASVGALGTTPFFESLSDLGQLSFDDAMTDDLYSQFTREDSYAGAWPPDDTGSDGLTAAKVLQERGLISGYQHTFSMNDALLALVDYPFIAGINWYSSFDQPTSSGEVKIAASAYVRGGHEVQASAVDVERARVIFWNSWGASWGLSGGFWMTFATFDRLLHEEGDVTVFVPRNEPAPTPTPIANPADKALAAAFRADGWVTSRHVGANRAVARAAATWLQAHPEV